MRRVLQVRGEMVNLMVVWQPWEVMAWCDHGIRWTPLPTRAALEGPHCRRWAALGVLGVPHRHPITLRTVFPHEGLQCGPCQLPQELGIGAEGW